MTSLAFAALIVAAQPAATALVYPLEAPDLTNRQRGVLTGALLTELNKLDGLIAIDALRARTVRQLFTEEGRRTCLDTPRCLLALNETLNAEYLVSGTVVTIEDEMVMTLRRRVLPAGELDATATRRVVTKDGQELLTQIAPLLEDLFVELGLRPGVSAGVSDDMGYQGGSLPLPPWLSIATAVVAIGAIAATVVFSVETTFARERFARLVNSDDVVSGAELVQLEQTANDMTFATNVGLGVAGALTLGAGLMAFFTDWRATVTVTPLGAGASVHTSW